MNLFTVPDDYVEEARAFEALLNKDDPAVVLHVCGADHQSTDRVPGLDTFRIEVYVKVKQGIVSADMELAREAVASAKDFDWYDKIRVQLAEAIGYMLMFGKPDRWATCGDNGETILLPTVEGAG